MKVLLTGASSGIGLAIAKKLLEENHQVIGCSRRAPPIDHPLFLHQFLDLKKPLNEQELITHCPDIDTLILSAGIAHFGFLEQLSPTKMEELMRVNFTSQALLVKAFLPSLKKQEKSDVLFLGSECALQGKQRASIYAASKFALRGFAQSLIEECQNSPVRVSILQPGLVNTPFYEKESFKPDDHSLKADDIAETVLWVLSKPRGCNLPEVSIFPEKPNVIWSKKKPKL